VALSIGIVGLPNVGKSTLFTALTNQSGLAANYPFATIEPNVGAVAVPDARLEELAAIVHPQRIVPAMVEFVDIAGLVKGAHQGEGLGNQFLSRIRETDAIVEVVRYFHDQDVRHVDASVDPHRDVDTINTELLLADLATLERALPRLEKAARRNREQTSALEAAARMQDWLNTGHRAHTYPFASATEREQLYDLHLLTAKPILYVANVDEDVLTSVLSTQPEPICEKPPLVISARLEADLAELAAESPDEARELLMSMGLRESGLVRLAHEAYKLLGLQSFFTAGPLEVRAWTIAVGVKAPQAAGVIHSDFEKGFIKAETASFADFVAYGGEAGLRAAGRLRQEGRDYIVRDGDVMHFKFSPRQG
jgi:GTP-binding protein YchF